MRILIMVLALAFASAPAGATLISYDMTFTNSADAVIGTGSFSFDTALSEAIWLFGDTGQRCDPADPDSLGFCNLYAIWTPLLSIEATVDGVDIGSMANGEQFVQGSYFTDGAPGPTSSWFFGDDLLGLIQLQMDSFNFTDTANFVFSAAPGVVGSDGVLETGTVSFARMLEAPLPAAVVLFPIALGFLFGALRVGHGREMPVGFA